jgi:murein L,D-transpeptidase YcbB/YkuD
MKVEREKAKDERPVRVVKKAKRKKVAVVDSLKALPKNYYLGERVIMKGDSGRDVRAMAKILINKLYIDEASLVYTAGDGVLYDGDLVRAVKHFQEFNGMYPDGIVGKETIKALRKRK